MTADAKNACDNVMTLLVGKGRFGKYATWSKDNAHRRDCKNFGIFRETWIDGESGALPWRLTQDDIKDLKQRTKNIRWPHGMERMFYRGFSMWEKPSRMWKCRRKHRLLFHVLPVQLRDKVPQFRDALVLFCWTLRRLDGQVHSYEVAVRLGILPGSRVLVRCKIKFLHKDLIRALVLIEGCVPVGHLIPT